MADLDDFFAKKDRKKSKSVKKYATTDEVTKKLDDPKQKTDFRPKKERPVQEGEEGSRAGVIQEEEEEWKEYEETVKDYTGLKIQVLQGGNNKQDSGRDNGSDDSGLDSARGKAPWNKPSENPEQPPVVEVEKPKEPPKPASSGSYVPPIARRTAAAAPVRKQHPKNAPDIHNDDYFPVLGARGGGGGGGGVARGGGWSSAGTAPARPAPHAAPLTLGNRYTHLQDQS